MTTITINNVYQSNEYDSWEEAADVETEAHKEVEEVEEVDVVELEPLDDDFPALGNWTTIPKVGKESVGSNLKSATKGRSKGVQMDISPTSRIAELRGRRQPIHGGVDDERSLAFDKLGNKEELSRDLTKTRLCLSVSSGKPCPHGERCRFAHYQSELVTNNCFFGGRCRFVKWGENQQKWYNCGGERKMCNHIHPDETRENYMSRTGMTVADKVNAHHPTSVDPVVLKLDPIQAMHHPTTSVDPVVLKLDPIQAMHHPTTTVDPMVLKLDPIQAMHHPPTTVDLVETVIKVPLCIAVQAIELVLKSGKHNVRVEVI